MNLEFKYHSKKNFINLTVFRSIIFKYISGEDFIISDLVIIKSVLY